LRNPLGSERLAEVAFLYYVRNLSQHEISEMLGASRSMVSRMLSAARDAGIVRFEINYPYERRADLENELMSLLRSDRLKDIVVVDVPENTKNISGVDRALVAVGQAAAGLFESRLQPGMTIGLSWGTTVQTVIELIKVPYRIDATVVQLSGEVSIDGVESAYDLVRSLADKLGASYQYLSVPAIAPTVEMAQLLAETTHIGDSLAQAAESDIAILGVGAMGLGRTGKFLDAVNPNGEELAELSNANVVGQICSRLFTADGHEPDIALNQRLLSVSVDQIRKIPEVLIVATDPSKAQAALGVLRGEMATTLVCDSGLAQAILHEMGKK